MAESEFHKKVNFVAFSNSKLSLITVQVAIMRITVTDTHQSIGMIREDFHEKAFFRHIQSSKLGLITLQKVVIGRLTEPLWNSSMP